MGTDEKDGSAGREEYPTFKDNPIESEYYGKEFFRLAAHGEIDCYLFRFRSPTCEDIFVDTGNFDNQANRSFLARCYWKRGERTPNVAIVFNGLDETIHRFDSMEDLFRLYEALGVFLAGQGVLTILLPTPYHMNRVLAYIDKEAEGEKRTRYGNKYRDLTVPTNALMHKKFNIYRNHFQGFKETLALCRCLCPKHVEQVFPQLVFAEDTVSDITKQFFRESVYTDGQIRISLIGYSLGGLRALTEYVRDRRAVIGRSEEIPPLFRRCVVINSGGGLDALPSPPWVERREWRQMIDNLLSERLVSRVEDRFSGIPEAEWGEAEAHFSVLEDVFLGQATSINSLERRDAERMLFILGARDDLVPLESLDRLKPPGGVNILHIAGMGHLYHYDAAWDRMKDVVFTTIQQFLKSRRSPRTSAPTPERFGEYVALLDHELRFLPCFVDIKKHTAAAFNQARQILEGHKNDLKLAARILGINRVKKIATRVGRPATVVAERFPEFAKSVVNTLDLRTERGAWHPGSYRRARRRLLLGAYLVPHNPDLNEFWESSIVTRSKKIGEALVDAGVIPEEAVERALAEQKRDFEKIRDHMAEDFRAFVKQERG